ncbi:MAG: aldo/keto reductase family protein [Planctomycetes bacterium]|nr:aldo/keto reductase family protein [Planctomycetota bacterium]
MQYRRLGRTGMKVSTVSLGSWLTFGRTVDQDMVNAIVKASFEADINTIDTADVYARGESESALGIALEGRTRRHYVLASKCFWPMHDTDVNDRGLSRKHIMESIDLSLERLKTSYLDLYQCHRFDPDADLRETVYAMEDLVRMGKIHYWGVSVWTGDQMRAATAIARDYGGYGPVSNQPQYSMLAREIEGDALPATRELGMGTIVWSPLAQGMLTGKYKDADDAPAGTRRADETSNQFIKGYMTSENFAKVEALKPIAAEVGCSLAQLALAWCLHQPGLTSVIVGATKVEQIAENAKASEVCLSHDVLARIEGVLAPSIEG